MSRQRSSADQPHPSPASVVEELCSDFGSPFTEEVSLRGEPLLGFEALFKQVGEGIDPTLPEEERQFRRARAIDLLLWLLDLEKRLSADRQLSA
ncbi:MAG TPA: hypothetical protein V6D17_23365 [Candidatus Obscuribacterales bacterium]